MQADLVKERLGQHVQHLLKFGRDVYDPLQYNAVVADINMPLLINAGKEPSCLPPPPKSLHCVLAVFAYAKQKTALITSLP